jgi:hypothetical protein
MLSIGKQKLPIIRYNEINRHPEFVLWRHDVDFSPESANRLAVIENEENIKATYFFLIRSEFYNLFEARTVRIVENILKLGHDIGLHFDSSFIRDMSTEESLIWEKGILETQFGIRINAFSFHNPKTEDLQIGDFIISGMVNTYSDYFKNEVDYASDSNGYWRHRPILDCLKSDSTKKQILTHPLWWQEEPLSPYQKIIQCINSRKDNTFEEHLLALKLCNRKLLDW